jgi:peptidoglycan/LPS O-acetylase OafA/YrhL
MKRFSVSQRFEFLDGLRGIAALGVILFHFNGTLKDHDIFIIPCWLDFLCQGGHYGVQIFFVLSGFVIAYSLRHEQFSFSYCLRFFLKRSIRLDPPYWSILGLMVLLNFLGNFLFDKKGEHLVTAPQILLNLFYLPDLVQVPRILPVAWTLCIEIQFYLTFVLLLQIQQFLVNQFYSIPGFIFSHLIFGLLLILSLLEKTSWAILSIPGLFVPYWYHFFIGCLICWRMLGFIRASWFWAYFGIIGSYSLIQGSLEALVTLVIAFIIYMVALLGGMHHLLTSRFFQYTGKISYSLYLIHWPIGMKFIDISFRLFRNEMHHIWSIAALMTISWMLTFLVAHCFYYLIESPSLSLSRRLTVGSSNKNCQILVTNRMLS